MRNKVRKLSSLVLSFFFVFYFALSGMFTLNVYAATSIPLSGTIDVTLDNYSNFSNSDYALELDNATMTIAQGVTVTCDSVSLSNGSNLIVNGILICNSLSLSTMTSLNVNESGQVHSTVNTASGSTLVIKGSVNGSVNIQSDAYLTLSGHINSFNVSDLTNVLFEHGANISQMTLSDPATSGMGICDIPFGTTVVNNSSSDFPVYLWESEAKVSIPAGDTLRYTQSNVDSIMSVGGDFGSVNADGNGIGQFTLNNPFFFPIYYMVSASDIYPFVFPEETLGTMLKARGEGYYEPSSEGSGYLIAVGGGSSKSVKVAVSADFAESGQIMKPKEAGSVHVLIREDVDDYFEFAPYGQRPGANLTATIAAKTVQTKKQGLGTVTVKTEYYGGKKPSVTVTSSTNDTANATIKYISGNTYLNGAPSKVGNYKVEVTFPSNDEYEAFTLTKDFSIEYLPAPQNPYELSGSEGEKGFYLGDVKVSAPEGYSVSDKLDGNYEKSLTITVKDNISKIYLQKDSTGEKTNGINLEEIKIDDKDPLIEGLENIETDDENEDVIYSDSLKLTISDDNLSSVIVNEEDKTFNGSSLEVELSAEGGFEKFIIMVKDYAGRLTEKVFTLLDEWRKTNSVPKGKKVKLYKDEEYSFGEGQWKASGDDTVYYGNNTFYVPSDVTVEFE